MFPISRRVGIKGDEVTVYYYGAVEGDRLMAFDRFLGNAASNSAVGANVMYLANHNQHANIRAQSQSCFVRCKAQPFSNPHART